MYDRVKIKLRIHEAKLLHAVIRSSSLVRDQMSRKDREIIFRLQKRFVTFENSILIAERRRANKARQRVKRPVEVSAWLELWEADTLQLATQLLMARTAVFQKEDYPALYLMLNRTKELANDSNTGSDKR